MAVKVKYKTKLDITKDMLKNISNMNGKRVEVGCFNGDHAWLAGIHEYGCNIKVTPKMRAYLHSKGITSQKKHVILTDSVACSELFFTPSIPDVSKAVLKA